LPSLVGFLNISSQNNNDLSSLWDFGRFRTEE
jgi:hypothetical protein